MRIDPSAARRPMKCPQVNQTAPSGPRTSSSGFRDDPTHDGGSGRSADPPPGVSRKTPPGRLTAGHRDQQGSRRRKQPTHAPLTPPSAHAVLLGLASPRFPAESEPGPPHRAPFGRPRDTGSVAALGPTSRGMLRHSGWGLGLRKTSEEPFGGRCKEAAVPGFVEVAMRRTERVRRGRHGRTPAATDRIFVSLQRGRRPGRSHAVARIGRSAARYEESPAVCGAFLMRRRGLEPPRAIQPTRPSTLRVYQFRHRRRWDRGGRRGRTRV
jgi:hypothetical protein